MPIECGANEELRKKYNKASMSYRRMWQPVIIGCGECIGCILDKAGDWATRVWCEQQRWKKCCFVTLTFGQQFKHKDKEGMPLLRIRELQLFMKKLRKHKRGFEWWHNPINGKFENPIRFFACGEYGDAKGRAHFHIILFNYMPEDMVYWKKSKKGVEIYKSKELQEIWGNGFITVQECNYKTAAYTARYTLKKLGTKKKWQSKRYRTEMRYSEVLGISVPHSVRIRKKPEKQPPFITMSRMPGIGLDYWINNKTEIKRLEYISIGISGHVSFKRIPRYFLKKWEDENFEEYHRYRFKKIKEGNKKIEKLIKEYDLPEDWNDDKKYKWILELKEKQLLSKLKQSGSLFRGLAEEIFVDN